MKANGSKRKSRGLIALGGFALVLAGPVAASAAAAGPPRADAPDLVAVHDATSPAYNKNCLACHGDIMTRPTLNPKFKEAHAAMVPFAPGYDPKAGVTSVTCAFCHRKVDLAQHSAALVRKNVNVSSCAMCHSRSGPAAKKFYN